MTILSIDIETYSSVDIAKSGVYAYTEAEDFQILLFGYAFDDDPVQVVDLASGEELPNRVLQAIVNPGIIKTAFNANFERICLSRAYRWKMPFFYPNDWCCTHVHALTLGLPGKLEEVAKVMKLEQQKDTSGKALLRYFSIPCKPTKTNGMRTRNLPHHDPEKWAQFKAYCAQDVEVERTIRKALERFPVLPVEQKLWCLDQRINDGGIRVDPNLVHHAIACDTQYQERKTGEAAKLTGLDNPNSVAQLKEWLLEAGGLEVDSLNKKNVPELLKQTDSDTVKRVLELRQELAKTSVKKYMAMDRARCKDDRIRGLLQFYGANRTGRWCLTGDHEILTSDGWVRLDEWNGGYIACWSPQTEFISFQKARSLSFDYTGELYSIESQRCSQLSTPDHKMAHWGKSSGWEVDTVENLAKKRFSIPFTGRRIVNSNLDHTELRILIMTQADGHYTKEGDLRFHFSKERKIERCKSLLRKCGLIFTWFKREKATVITVKSRNMPIWLRTFRDKTFKMWLLDESADVVFDELERWDAYRCGPNSIQYSTINKQNADVIQALAHLSGRAATIVTKIRDHVNWNDAYAVNIWLTPGGHNEIRNKPDIVPFSGKVYCAETDTGFFMVRRNGRVWVTGNSGRLVQVQNLPQNHLKDLDLARNLLLAGDYETIEMLFESVPGVLSQLIRTAFIPSEGHTFMVADFSAIEARVIAWLAGEKWRLDVFNTHGKIYEASASQMFKIPMDKITKDLRQRGKVAELALGYQGGPGALISMGALDKGLTEEELPGIVKAWRASSPNIVQFWRDAEKAAIEAVNEKKQVTLQHGLAFSYESGMMFIRLPSGRRLTYVRPRVEIDGRFNQPKLTYEGMDQVKKQWMRMPTYGGRLVENIVQATARDCLAEAMLRLDAEGYKIVMHVHDEVVLDVPHGFSTLEKACEITGQPIKWAPGLPMRADGFETDYYKKDD